MSNSSVSRFWGVVAVLGLTMPALLFLAYSLDQAGRQNPPIVPLFALLAVAGMYVALVRGPIGRGIGRMLEGNPGSDDKLADRMNQLESQNADLVYEQQRLLEVEERLDFAERLLAQRGAPITPRPPEVN
jgi:hypothetical protein